MISKEYKSKKALEQEKYKQLPPPISNYTGQQPYIPPYTRVDQQGKPGITYFSKGFTPLSVAATRAAKIGISTNEWQRRDEIVRRISDKCELIFMDQFYPSTKAFYEQYGKCAFLSKPGSYEYVDKEDWPESDDPMIFTVRPLAPKDGNQGHIFCNLAFMRKDEPTA